MGYKILNIDLAVPYGRALHCNLPGGRILNSAARSPLRLVFKTVH